MKRKIQMVLSLIILSGCLVGCSFPTNLFKPQEIEIIPTPTPLPYKQLGVLEVEGSVYDSPDSYYGKYNRPFVLYDLSGVIKNNETWIMNPSNMVIAHLDSDNKKMKYILHLPTTPKGLLNGVYDNGRTGDGVQVFTYWWAKDIHLSDYVEEDEQYSGWPINDLAIRFDETGTQIVSGWMLVWVEDNQQMFPVNVGEDGVLFTKDDVMAPILPGYTSVYLEDGTLTWDRSEKVKVSILSPYDIRQFDLSHKEPIDAFDQTVKLLEENYQYWKDDVDAAELEYIKNALKQEMESAVKDDNQEAVNTVFGKLVSTLDDGMISLSSNANMEMIEAAYPADFGFAAQTFSDGLVRITDMRISSPTFSTNLDYGYIILEVDDKPVDEALSDTQLAFFPEGNEEVTRRLQEILLFRKPEDAKIKIKVLDLKGEEETLTLTSTADTELLVEALSDVFNEFRSYESPVVAEKVESFGVIHVYDMEQDPSLTKEMFERSLIGFRNEGVTDYVIDLRGTGGDTFLHLAGFFSSSPITLAEYSCADDRQWTLKLKTQERKFFYSSISVLIDSGCRGACEFEALAFSKLGTTTLYGHTPSNGAFDIDFQASIKLPNDLKLNFPYCKMDTIRFPNDQESFNIVPDVVLGKSFYEGLKGSSYMIDHVVYSKLREDFEYYTKKPLEALTINELIRYYDDAVYINSTVNEDQGAIFYYHDQPSYDLHIPIYRETDVKGTFDYSICMDSYGELMPVVDVVTPTFYLDSEELGSINVYESSYLSDNNQNCYFWLFGTRTFPPGIHEITVKLTVDEPVIFHESLWEPGEYEFHYQFIFTPNEED